MSMELRDMASRAEQAGYSELAVGYRRDAQAIEDAGGPKYFSENSTQTRAPELVLPEPSPEILEVHRILVDRGFDVAQIAYVDQRRRTVTHAVIETVVRPDYTDGTQMYYKNPDEDPLAQILERGRKQGDIAVPNWVRRKSKMSRFAVSWDETHDFVAPEVVKTTPHLAETLSRGGIALRVPTKVEFQFAGKTYPHFGEANSWEWLYDKASFGYRLVGGSRDSGGLGAVHVWRSDSHDDSIAFRLQAVSLSQKLPR